MKEQIYQNGFYTLIGLILGMLCMCIFQPKQEILEIEKPVYVHDTIKVEKHITLNEKNVLQEMYKLNIKHPKVVLAQAKLESNNFSSNLVKTHNNFLGIKKGKSYAKYDTWNECLIDYQNRVQNKYKGGDYYAFLKNIGYAEDPEYINKLKRYA